MMISATKVFPPLVGWQISKLLPSLPALMHSSCHSDDRYHTLRLLIFTILSPLSQQHIGRPTIKSLKFEILGKHCTLLLHYLSNVSLTIELRYTTVFPQKPDYT